MIVLMSLRDEEDRSLMSLRDEMGSEALRGAQRKKKRNGFRSLERSTTKKEKKWVQRREELGRLE